MLASAISSDSILLGAIIPTLARAYGFVLRLTLIEALAVIGHHFAKLSSQTIPIIEALALLR